MLFRSQRKMELCPQTEKDLGSQLEMNQYGYLGNSHNELRCSIEVKWFLYILRVAASQIEECVTHPEAVFSDGI